MTTYNLNIHHDEDAENPLTSWEGQPLIFVKSDGYIEAYNNGQEEKGTFYLPDLNRQQCLDNWQELTGQKSITNFLRENQHYGGEPLQDVLNYYLDQQLQYNCTLSEKLELIHEVYSAMNLHTLSATTTRYSQGDHAELLVVLTPEWMNGAGEIEDINATMQSYVDLHGAWAWGDCYGYTITKPVTCECCDNTDDEEIASCWGFYGSDHTKSGLLDNAKSNLEEGDVLLLEGEPV